ncbi:hypothetical protein Tco_1451674 [Tanacetum coccineum]
MAPKKRTTRASPTTTTTTTTPVTNAQLKALFDQGVADALSARDADRSMNGDDSYNSGTGVRILQISQENGQNRAKTNTRRIECTRARSF